MSERHTGVVTREPSLRERQADQVRLAVLEATLSALDQQAADDVSMADVAGAAGISLRTLYRYFPDRPALLHAAGEHLYRSLGVPIEIAGPDDIAPSLLDAARRLSERPDLTRTLVRTSAGRTLRSGVRGKRIDAIKAALKPLTDAVAVEEARCAAAVITHLCSAAAWVLIAGESDLEDAEAQRAVAWAIDALVATLRQDAAAQPSAAPARRNATAQMELS